MWLASLWKAFLNFAACDPKHTLNQYELFQSMAVIPRALVISVMLNQKDQTRVHLHIPFEAAEGGHFSLHGCIGEV